MDRPAPTRHNQTERTATHTEGLSKSTGTAAAGGDRGVSRAKITLRSTPHRVRIYATRWRHCVLKFLIAVAIGVAIWMVAIRVIRMLATPPPDVDPSDIVPVDIKYRCTLCGTEVTMTAVSVSEGAAPKHCREEMDEVPT